MTFNSIIMGIFLTIIILLILLWPTIRRLTARFVANRTEDYIRKATGMPPRPGSKDARRQAKQNQGASNSSRQQADNFAGSRSESRRQRREYRNPNEPLIPKEYAEDVEFVETISYSETTIGATSSDGRTTIYHESQVSDVEWEEIRLSGTSKKRS